MLLNAAAQARIVSVTKIRLYFQKSGRPFKGIICDDISEFESYLASHGQGRALSGQRTQRAYQGYAKRTLE